MLSFLSVTNLRARSESFGSVSKMLKTQKPSYKEIKRTSVAELTRSKRYEVMGQ